MKSNDYITYTCLFLSLLPVRTIQLIPSHYLKLIPYELVGEPNGPIDHELQWFKINWLNSFRPS